jgi:PAS domain S-box-containing protein
VLEHSHISTPHPRNGTASRDIFDAIQTPLAVCDSLTGAVLYANAAFSRAFGYGGDALPGLQLASIGATPGSTLLSGRLARTRTGTPQAFPWVVRGARGTQHRVRLFLSLVDDAGARRILAQFHTEGGSAEADSDRGFSEAIVNSLPSAFYLVDIDGHVVRWNSMTERVSGYSADDIRAMHPEQFFLPDDATKVRDALQRAFSTGSAAAECTLLTKSGRAIPFLLSGRRIMIHGAPFVAGIGVDIGERKRIEDALRRSEERYRSLIEEMREVVFTTDESGVVTYVSSSVEGLLGYRPEEIVGQHFAGFIFSEDLPRVQAEFEDLARGVIEPSEYRIRTSRGDTRWVQSSSKPRIRDGRFLGIAGIMTDVNDRKVAEEALHESVKRFRNVFEMSPMGMHMYHLEDDGTLVFAGANPAADRILGLQNANFVGLRIDEAFPRLSATEIPARYAAVARGGGSWHTDQVFYEDHRITGAFEVHAFQTSPGQMVAAFIDITDRKRAEAELRESRERLDLAVSGADLGLWDWDIPTGHVTHNPRWAEMLGFNPDELESSFSTWERLVHPDDKQRVLQLLQDHVDGRASIYEAELRLQTKDGGWRWILDRGKVVRRDASGAPVRVSGTQLDITDRREAENLLRESLQEKELLLREIHHRVKNNLQVISSLFNLQVQTVTDPNVLAALKESHNRIRSMGLVHHMMYQAADFAAIDLVDYIQTLTRSLYRSYSVDPERVLLAVDIANVRLGIDAAIPCGLIINELVSNALRHAYPDGRRGTLRVTLSHNGDGTHTLTVGDNGIGLPPDLVLPPTSTLGLALVDTLTRQLEGTLSVDRTGGTSVSVQFAGIPRA